MAKKKATEEKIADPLPLRLEWRDPGELSPNPANWRTHPQKQVASLQAAMAEVGWAGALLYNERTQRLIDGHARQDLFAGKGKVPVLIGSWDEATEAKILATLDPLAAMAETDAAALDALLRDVDTGSEALQAMLADLATEAGLYETPAEVVEDEVPEAPAVPVTKPGRLVDSWGAPSDVRGFDESGRRGAVDGWGEGGDDEHRPAVWNRLLEAERRNSAVWIR